MNLSDDFVSKTQRQMQISTILAGLGTKYCLQYVLEKLRNSEPKLECGKVNLKKLTANTKSIKTMDIEKDGVKAFDKLCKKYGIMYNIVKDKSNNDIKFSIFYREEDTERVQKALENMVKEVKKDIAQTKETYIKNDVITKNEITNIQNRFENILKEVTEKEASLDYIVENSVEGISDLTKVKSKIKEPLEAKIKKAKLEKLKAPIKQDFIKKGLSKVIGGR